ncbi:Ribosomal RNA small subunit methyltransferase E [Methylibium sp. T29-B]|nr:Ribosomal RNA small subunit methyltransferase E [Methylibium sp. T29-B]
MPRFLVDMPLADGLEAALPAAAARHVQVLRLQPGDGLTLFDGRGSEWEARVVQMGRSEVRVRVGASQPVDRELPLPISLAVGMPANERMDWLVEKATELGVSTLQPLVCERSVLRLGGERADRKLAHWQAWRAPRPSSAAAPRCRACCRCVPSASGNARCGPT